MEGPWQVTGTLSHSGRCEGQSCHASRKPSGSAGTSLTLIPATPPGSGRWHIVSSWLTSLTTRPVEQSPLLTVGGGNGAWPAAGPLRGSKPKDTGGAAANRGAPANRFFLPLCPPGPQRVCHEQRFPQTQVAPVLKMLCHVG